MLLNKYIKLSVKFEKPKFLKAFLDEGTNYVISNSKDDNTVKIPCLVKQSSILLSHHIIF